MEIIQQLGRKIRTVWESSSEVMPWYWMFAWVWYWRISVWYRGRCPYVFGQCERMYEGGKVEAWKFLRMISIVSIRDEESVFWFLDWSRRLITTFTGNVREIMSRVLNRWDYNVPLSGFTGYRSIILDYYFCLWVI